MKPLAKTIIKYTLLAALMAYIGFIAVWARQQASQHTCKGITISMEGRSGADTITVQGVKHEILAYGRKIVGMPVNTINTLELERYLKRHDNFEDVSCHMGPDGRLNVHVVPMIPEIRVFDGNQSYYVNKDGKRVASNAEFYTDVPVVSGHFTKQFPPSAVLPVVRFVENDSLLRHIAAMYVANDPGNIIIVPRITGHVINIGDTTRLPEKRRAILTAYRNIIPYKGWDQYDTISVKFRGQIVATRRDKAPLHPTLEIVEDADPEEAALPQSPNPDDSPQPTAAQPQTVAATQH